MPKMQIVTDEMLNRAGIVGQNTSRILESQSQVTRLFQNLGRNFSGRIPTLMTQSMLAMEKDYKAMNGILTGYKDFLEDSAHTYDWTEAELAKWAESLGDKSANPSGNNSNTSTSYSTETSSTVSMNNANTESAELSTPSGYATSAPDLSSEYYSKYDTHATRSFPANSEYNHDSVEHLNCVHYARARAMEVNHLDTCPTFPASGTSTQIRENSVAWYHKTSGGTHAVYVERVKYDNNGNPEWVWFSDSNMVGQADGTLHDMSYEAFQTYDGRKGWSVANYDYF